MVTGPHCPPEIKCLIKLAISHVRDRKLRESEVLAKSRKVNGIVLSLVELSRKVIMENVDSVDIYALPKHILDGIIRSPYTLWLWNTQIN